MNRQKVEGSNNIVSIGYDPDSQDMQVEFVSGKSYEYKNVPATAEEADGRGNWEEFLKADSKGGYFARHFRQWPDQAPVAA